MRPRSPHAIAPLALLASSVLALLCGCGSSSGGRAQSQPDASNQTDPLVWVESLHDDPTCILACDPACKEASKPWVCPALAAWDTLPHDRTAAACGGFDGGSFPAPVHGKCTVSAPTGDAVEKTNAMGTPVVLPDGRRVEPAGTEWVFDDFPGGFPSAMGLGPKGSWLFVVDTGYTTHSVRALSTAALQTAGTNPVTSSIRYDPPAALNWGMGYATKAHTLYVASGYQSPDDTASQIFAYDFDAATGALTASTTRAVPLPAGTFPQAVAVSADESTLLVGQVTSSQVLVFSLAAATYGQMRGVVDVGSSDVYELRFDPDDAAGTTAYASLWVSPASGSDPSKMVVAQLDLAAMKSTPLVVGKEPEDLAFLDARYMVVASGLSDSLSLVDRAARTVATTIPLGTTGLEPTSLAYDAPRGRLYATLASANAVEVFTVDDTATPPSVVPIGKLPTAWWPTAVVVDPADGTLYVTSGRAHGTPGLNTNGDNGSYLRGSVQRVPYMDSGAVATATATAEGDANPQGFAGQPVVDCGGAPYDFPIPARTTDGPSPVIKHVIFIERENKTFDALFGDLPGVDGDKSMLLSPQFQDSIWANARKWATEFSHLDNYYSDAEQSIQGHYWDVFGRSSDVDERRWVVTWGRGEFGSTQSPGVSEDSAPLEGSVFSTLLAHGVTIENDGELVGGLAYRNGGWFSGSSNATIPDTVGACYLAGRARATCDLKQFTYAWLGNDHTFGMSPGYPNPSIMMAVNDEATGMILDGVSHSPEWASTLVLVIEDDPSTGQDHVDMHRSIALLASPWVRRGYVSHGHYDIASIHKLIAHVFGQPYANAEIANAPLPLDVFTSTPDYAPFSFVPRSYSDASCNVKGTRAAERAGRWDFSRPDEQPGLGGQIQEWMRTPR